MTNKLMYNMTNQVSLRTSDPSWNF